jgi:predicted RNA binding protein YcfA (HicA-like mRNA interferase family)
MPNLKKLGADDLVSVFTQFGFEKVSQKGSHIKLVKHSEYEKQVLVIPSHKNIKKGTLKAIYNQASKFISQDELSKHFYTE